jgi:uncharacterized repeat protein (TIGR02543 family)
VLYAIAQDGTARIIVELDVLWQPEGLLADASAVAAQRGTMTNTQTQFVEEVNQELENDGIIDSAHSADGTPTVPAVRTFETVPYLVMVVNSVTLPYVQQNLKASSVQLSVPDEAALQESIPLIGANKAWEQGFSGQDQLIAVVDSGVDKSHPWFAPSRVVDEACFSFTKDCPNNAAEQVGSGAAVPCDFDADNCGHGTHVAGIAASVAKDAGIVAVQVASNFGRMGFFRDDQIAALEFLHKKYGYFGTPLAAVNMSIGGGKHTLACDGDARRKIIQNLHSVGVATIASSGNQGHADGISAPACLSEVISVGATDKSGNVAEYSNTAPILDFFSPGSDIGSAIPGGSVEAKSGTSMAAPHVAGAWAIMKAANPKASIAKILGKLKDTGKDVDGIPRIQVDAALPQVQPAQSLNDGLVLHLGFDGNANDGSGNENHGIEYGDLTYADGKIGQAASFNGINNTVEVPHKTELSLTEWSISAWVKSISMPTVQTMILAKDDDNRNRYNYAVVLRANRVCAQYETVPSDFDHTISGYNGVAKNNWFHVTQTRSNNGEHRIYVNAILEESGTWNDSPVQNNEDLIIGRVFNSATTQEYYQGFLDDIRLYNRALSESEIKQLYGLGSNEVTLTVTKTGEGEITSTDNTINCGETCQADYEVDSIVTLTATPTTGSTFSGWTGDCSGTSTTTTVTMDSAKNCSAVFEEEPVANNGCDIVKDGLVACYPFDGNANDGSGNGNHGTEHGVNYVAGKIGQAAHFDGIDDYLSISVALNGSADWTVCTWLNVDRIDSSYTDWQNIISNNDVENRIEIGFSTSSKMLKVWNSDVKIQSQTNAVSVDVPIFVCYSKSSNALTIYKDGAEIAQNQGGEDISFSKFRLIGMWIESSSNPFDKEPLAGYLDNLSIYNRALTESEIQTLYGLGSDEVALTVTKTGEGEITSTDNTINCGETCQADYEVDSTVTLTATPATGSTFTGWSGDCTGTSATTTVIMDAAKSCAATFEKKVIPVGSCDGPTDGLVACYSFDGNANDESSNENHGTVHGATLTEDRFGNAGSAYSFDGQDDYIENDTFVDIDKTITVTGWIKYTSLLPNMYTRTIVGKADNNGSNTGFTLHLKETTGGIPKVRYIVNDDNGGRSDVYTDQIDIDTWYFVAASYDGTEQKIYLDGKLNMSIENLGTIKAATSNLLVGKSDVNRVGYFQGLIDDIRIYNRALSEQEIKQLYGLETLTVTKTGEGEITTTDNTINCGETCQADYEVDSTVTLTATPATGSTFTGWSGDCTGTSATTTVTMDAAKSCAATFVQASGDSLKVTKTGNGRGTTKAKIKGEKDWTILCKSDCQQASYDYAPDSEVILKASPEKGFTFNGWTGDCTGTDKSITVTIATPKTCTAQFEPEATSNLLTVNQDGTGNGTITTTDGYINCGTNCSAFYRADKTFSLKATPTTDNLFMGWSGACSGLKDSVRITMDAAKSCTATFKAHNPAAMLTLTVNNGGDGLGTISGRVKGEKTSLTCKGSKGCKQATHEYASGTQVTLYATPNTGFEFTDGSGDCPWETSTDSKGRLKASATVIMDQAKDCTANFGLKSDITWHKLTVYTGGTGNGSVNNPSRIDCGNNCTADYYQAGKTFWLKAIPTPLSKFIGWTGDCESKGTRTKVTISQDMTCTANFQSDFEIIAEEIVDAFYAIAKSGDEIPVAEIYPRPANEARLKEAFWLTVTAIKQVDQHLAISNNQTWPTQFNGIEWLPPDANVEYTHSIQIAMDQTIEIVVELITDTGTKEVTIVMYYTDDPSSWITSRAYFSRYFFRLFW